MQLTAVESRPSESGAHFRWSTRVVAQLAVLALAAYVYVLAELAPIGAMPAIASDLHVSEAHVGMLTAAYAFISVMTTLPLARCTAQWPRRRVLILTLMCLTVSQALSAIAPSLALLAVCRVVCATTHGLMWSTVAPLAARLVPATHTGRATTAVYLGTSAALIVGNPLTSAMSQAWGWRPTVAVMAIAAATITMLARIVLPAMPVVPLVPGRADAARVRRRWPHPGAQLGALCVLTLIGVTAHFACYTYIVAVIRDVARVDGGMESVVLAAYGVAGLIAMTLLARAIDQRPHAAVATGLAVLCLAFWSLGALAFTGAGPLRSAVGIGAVIVWGASAATLPPMLQSAAIRTSPDDPEEASALYVSAFQVGIVAGSTAGGFLYAHCGISIVVATSSILFAVALAGVLARKDVFCSPAPANSMSTDIDLNDSVSSP